MINQEDCKRCITGSLERVVSSTACCEAIDAFKWLLNKCKQDGIISDHESAPFVKEIWERIHNIHTFVVALENHVNVLDSKFKRLEQVQWDLS
eukprot:8331158-Ditylum_brightwellii.AAC.1